MRIAALSKQLSMDMIKFTYPVKGLLSDLRRFFLRPPTYEVLKQSEVKWRSQTNLGIALFQGTVFWNHSSLTMCKLISDELGTLVMQFNAEQYLKFLPPLLLQMLSFLPLKIRL